MYSAHSGFAELISELHSVTKAGTAIQRASKNRDESMSPRKVKTCQNQRPGPTTELLTLLRAAALGQRRKGEGRRVLLANESLPAALA